MFAAKVYDSNERYSTLQTLRR